MNTPARSAQQPAASMSHQEQARDLMVRAGGYRAGSPDRDSRVQEAQVYAVLAAVEQLTRVADTLGPATVLGKAAGVPRA